MRAASPRILAAALFAAAASCAQPRDGAHDVGASAHGAVAANASNASNAEFAALVKEVREFTFRMQPTQATYFGNHDHDGELEDFSRAGVEREIAGLRQLRARAEGIAAASLCDSDQLDREQLIHGLDSRLLTLQVVRPWATNADTYGSGITNSAYILIKREFAPLEQRLRFVIARERKMPAALAEARANLEAPPRILTQIALEQIGGERDFFATALPAAFAAVKDAALLVEFKSVNDAVVAAMKSHEDWMRDGLLPHSTGDFALGAAVYREKLWDDEMVDLPLERLLEVATIDLRRNQATFAATAKQIDANKTPAEVLASLQVDHPKPAELLDVTQRELDALEQFLVDHHIVSIPPDSPAAKVQETPPFLRALTSASMDTPGPYEPTPLAAFYSMTLPDPDSKPAEQEEFMTQWYFAAITNVSVHEVWPGHYLQFLHARHFPSDVRKLFSAATNVEGWAHYAEQMMVDEGLHAGQPQYRLAQLQDALLRDVRFIAGIKLHTQGMTVPQAKELFEREAYQPGPVADAESKRGTSDPTYGYYTMGKLMILKLRKDWLAKRGEKATLQQFHDEFIRLGPLPLPLIRRAMLGEAGQAL
jgi:uncharacterized protein (DUF885 family)